MTITHGSILARPPGGSLGPYKGGTQDPPTRVIGARVPGPTKDPLRTQDPPRVPHRVPPG